MVKLESLHCIVCRSNTPSLPSDELSLLMSQLPQWRIETREGIMQLERVFSFINFVDAMAFSQKVAELAENEGHHPAILTEWGKVTVTWWTHTIKGLHHNDFICAARTDLLYA